MPHLEPDPFLNELNKLYEQNKNTGSVWVTFKRKDWRPREKSKTTASSAASSVAGASASSAPAAAAAASSSSTTPSSTEKQTKKSSSGSSASSGSSSHHSHAHSHGVDDLCLIRATDGKTKLSTTIRAKDVVRFQMSLTTILKAHVDNLKKREKPKKKVNRHKLTAL